MLSDWQKRRSDLNHGRLGNEFRTDLGNAVSVLKGNARWPGSIADLMIACVGKWQTIAKDTQALLDSFAVDMSPRRYFEVPPLCNCDMETKAWLPELVHDLWLNRRPVATWIAEARTALKAADSACKTMHSLVPGTSFDDAGARQVLTASAMNFQEACDELVANVSKSPPSILL